ncbi:MAG: SlyX family protein [Phycisphaerales bacterium JB052]
MGDKQLQERLERLEHAMGFADRHVEILSGEVVELNKTMTSMARRIERLESRLVEINEKVGEAPPNVPPPHSAGPDVPRDPL